MDQFANLEPRIRACALVGMFLQEWSFVEARLRSIIGKALGLNQLQAAILAANMQLRDKIHVVNTIVGLTQFSNQTRSASYRVLLNEIASYSKNRNMMAHDFFAETKNGEGVSFFVIRAKGNFSLPDVTWSIEAFKDAYKKLRSFYDELGTLEKDIGRASVINALTQLGLSDAVRESGVSAVQGLLDSLFLHPQTDPDSSPNLATPEKDVQTPPDPTDE